MDGPGPIAAAGDPARLAATLDALGPRPAGSYAERAAALTLARALAAPGRRTVAVEPVWVRPRWELATALCVLLGVAGSVVAMSSPAASCGLALAGLAALALDARGWSPLRWLTPSRATQNVVAVMDGAGAGGAAAGTPSAVASSRGAGRQIRVAGSAVPPGATDPGRRPSDPAARVVLVARCDTARGGLPSARWVRRLARSRLTLGIGPLGWVALALLAVAICAATRAAGGAGVGLGAVQLAPTLVLIAALGVLVDGALAGPAAGDATGAAAAVALVQALDASPPRWLAVDVVIAGADAAQALGFRSYLRSRRPPRERTVVVELSACRAGAPRWWTADGALIPLRFHPRLTALARRIAGEERHLRAAPVRGRGQGAAWRARQRRLPAIRLGCLPGDPAARPDPASAEAAVELALALIHALDADLATAADPAAAEKTRRT